MSWSATRKSVRITLVALMVGATPLIAPMVAGGDSLTDTRVEARRIADELQRLQVRESVLGEDFDQAQLALSQLQSRVEVSERQVVRARREVDRHRNDLRRYAVGAYTAGNDESLQIVFHSEGNDLGRRMTYESVTTGDQADLIDALRTATSDQDAAIAHLRRAQDAARKARDDVDRKRNAVTSLVAKQQQLLNRVHGRLKALVAQAEAARAAAAAEAAHAAAMQAAAKVGATAPPAPTVSRAPHRTAPRVHRVTIAQPSMHHRPDPASSTTAPAVPTAAPAPTTSPVAVTPPITTPVAPAPAPPPPTTAPPTTTPTVPSPAPGSGDSVIKWAETRLGSPYVWGAAGPGAFDCSGLVLWSFAQAGRGNLPHSSRAMYDMSLHIPLSALQPGDLVFFGQPVHHVGIYIGGGTMIDALNSRTPVAFHSIYGISETPLAGRI